MNQIGVRIELHHQRATVLTPAGRTVCYRVTLTADGDPVRGDYLPARSTAADDDEHRQHVDVSLALGYGASDELLYFDVSSFYDENGLTIGWEHPMYLHCLTVGALAGEDDPRCAEATRQVWLETRQRIQDDLTKRVYRPGKVALRNLRPLRSSSLFSL